MKNIENVTLKKWKKKIDICMMIKSLEVIYYYYYFFFSVDLKNYFQTREEPHHEHLYPLRYRRPHNQHIYGQVLAHIPSGGALINAPTGRMFIHLQHMFSF